MPGYANNPGQFRRYMPLMSLQPVLAAHNYRRRDIRTVGRITLPFVRSFACCQSFTEFVPVLTTSGFLRLQKKLSFEWQRGRWLATSEDV